MPKKDSSTTVAELIVWRPARRVSTTAAATAGASCFVPSAGSRLARRSSRRAPIFFGIAARIATAYPQTNEGVGAWLVPLHEQITGPTRPALMVMTGAVLLVLLIGCANLASLLLLRAAARAREMSVRAALGAGRGRLLRQLLTESGVLAVLGGALGLLVAWWGSRLLDVLVPPGVRAVQQSHLDGTAVAFVAALSLVAGIIFGLVPAFQSARPDLMTGLRTAGRGGASHGPRLRNGLVVAELALAVMLLVGAGLLGQSFLRLERVDLGYRTDSVATATVFFPATRYADVARATDAIENVVTRLRAKAWRFAAPRPPTFRRCSAAIRTWMRRPSGSRCPAAGHSTSGIAR